MSARAEGSGWTQARDLLAALRLSPARGAIDAMAAGLAVALACNAALQIALNE